MTGGSGRLTRRHFLLGSAAVGVASAGLVGAEVTRASAGRTPHVAFTWDGPWFTMLANGFPLFQKHGFPATAFVITGKVGLSWTGDPADRYCTWDEIASLAASGWEISNHTVDHIGFKHLTPDQVQTEISDAKQQLVDRGYATPGFAYPYDDVTDAGIAVARDLHEYAMAGPAGGAFTDIHTVHRLYTLPREPVGKLTATHLIEEARNACLEQGEDLAFIGHHVLPPDQYSGQNMTVSTDALGGFLRWLARKHQQGVLKVTTGRDLVRDHLLAQ